MNIAIYCNDCNHELDYDLYFNNQCNRIINIKVKPCKNCEANNEIIRFTSEKK